MTLNNSRRRTSSPEPGSGQLQLGLPDGLTTDPSGQDRAPVNPSLRREKGSVSTIQGTCGPTSFDLSEPVGPLSSWESRLRERLAMVGSTESALIWKVKATPAGRSISRLARWTPPISETESIGSPCATWPTPMAGTPAQNGNSAAGNNDGIRKMEMILGMRETINGPKVSGPITNGSSATTKKRDVSRGSPNPVFAMWLMGLPENLRNAILRVCSSLPSRGGNKPGRSRETP